MRKTLEYKIRLRRYFLTGVLVTAPVALTIYILDLIVKLADSILQLLPPEYHPDHLLPFKIPGLGLVLTLVLVLISGFLVSNMVGNQLLQWWESLLGRIPLVRGIYNGSKQLMETLFSSSSKSFRKVVLIEYPRRGSWTLGFVTGSGVEEVEEKLDVGKVLNVFVPTTPNPTSGYLLLLPENDAIPLEMTVEEGLKLVISGGIMIPPPRSKSPPEALEAPPMEQPSLQLPQSD
ncbi:MAG: DUF502 domain-containing protein [Magnetococcales bacterium]|nr:DUF502 domain-containing protein [Magnetococcales bacterium]